MYTDLAPNLLNLSFYFDIMFGDLKDELKGLYQVSPNYQRTKFACYAAYFTMSSIFCVPPLLFVTFHQNYNVSYTLLGTLVLTNFCTQLTIDLLFTFFSKFFNAKKMVRIMPLITALGLAFYALFPILYPQMAYVGLLIGTLIFSVSAGLSEVLLSPLIAAIPSRNPQRDMSILHSLYAFGTFFMILVSTMFLKVFGADLWWCLILVLATLPVIPAVLFMLSPIPKMNTESMNHPAQRSKQRAVGLILCVGCIFFGSCAENTMANWISSYMENALGLDKTVGDVLGVAMFAILLGLARILYAKFGKNIVRVLLIGMAGAAVCYLIVGLSSNVVLALLACIFTGFCTSMLWPGTLIMMEEKIPHAGVAAFALMASGGDMGAAVAPQLMGIVIDKVSASALAARLGESLQQTPEQIGLRAGMLLTVIFPIMGMIFIISASRYFKRCNFHSDKEETLEKESV